MTWRYECIGCGERVCRHADSLCDVCDVATCDECGRRMCQTDGVWLCPECDRCDECGAPGDAPCGHKRNRDDNPTWGAPDDEQAFDDPDIPF